MASVDIFVRGHDQASGPIGGVARAFSSLAAVAGGFLAANVIGGIANQIGAMVPQAIEAISFSERLTLSLQSLAARELMTSGGADNMTDAFAQTSGAAADLLGWVTQLAIRSPFGRREVADTLRFAMTFGFTATQAQDATKAVLDYATATGLSGEVMGRIVLALGQMNQAQKVNLIDIRQLANAGVPALEYLARGFDKTTGEIMEMITAGTLPANESIQMIIDSMEADFPDAGAKMTDSMAGLVNTFGDIKEMGLAALFQGIADAILPIAANFSTWLQGPGLEKLRETGELIGDIVQHLIFVAEGGDPGSHIFRTLPDDVQAIVGPPATIVALLRDFEIPADIQDSLDGLVAAFEEKAPAIQAAAENAAAGIRDAFANVMPEVTANLAISLDGLTALLQANGDEAAGVMGFVGEAIGVGLANAILLSTAPLAILAQLLGGDLPGAAETFNTTLTTVLANVLALFGTSTAQIEAFFAGLPAKVAERLNALAASITEKLNAIAANMAAKGAAIIQGLIDGIKSKAAEVIALAGRIADDISNALGSALGIHSPSTVMVEMGKNIMAGLAKGMTDNATGPVGMMGGMAGGMASAPQIGGGVTIINPAPVMLDGRQIGLILFDEVKEGLISSGALPSGAFSG